MPGIPIITLAPGLPEPATRARWRAESAPSWNGSTTELMAIDL